MNEPESAAFLKVIIKTFGGYEALVRARWAETMSERIAPKRSESACFEESLTQIESRSGISFLVLLRTIQGRLCLSGSFYAQCGWRTRLSESLPPLLRANRTTTFLCCQSRTCPSKSQKFHGRMSTFSWNSTLPPEEAQRNGCLYTNKWIQCAIIRVVTTLTPPPAFAGTSLKK